MSRKDRHGAIIKACRDYLRDGGFNVTEFHSFGKMPPHLKGFPDLHIMRKNRVWHVEIKPLYENYMRDQMSNAQWTWFHERYSAQAFGPNNRYAIVTNHEDIVYVLEEDEEYVSIPIYHWDRYDKWRRGR